jgi:hypothetical protein
MMALWETSMAKGQMRSNREPKKAKQPKATPAAVSPFAKPGGSAAGSKRAAPASGKKK